MQRLHVCLPPSPLRQEISHTNTYTMVSAQWLHQVELAGFVAAEYDIFCHRYLENGSALSAEIMLGIFVLNYEYSLLPSGGEDNDSRDICTA